MLQKDTACVQAGRHPQGRFSMPLQLAYTDSKARHSVALLNHIMQPGPILLERL